MKNKFAMVAVSFSLVLALRASAGSIVVPFILWQGTDSTEVLTQTANEQGYVEEIIIQSPTKGGTTSLVTVVATPSAGTNLTPTVLFTNASLTAGAVIRPRISATDNTGAAFPSNTVPTERYFCTGDDLALSVDQTSTKTGFWYRVWIKIND